MDARQCQNWHGVVPPTNLKGLSLCSPPPAHCPHQCRLRGRIDTNGVVAAYLEERMNMGVNFLLSAEVCSPFTVSVLPATDALKVHFIYSTGTVAVQHSAVVHSGC